MPSAEFFARLGLFVARDVLTSEELARTVPETRSATANMATVGVKPGVYAVDERIRSTKIASVSDETTALVESRLLSLKPALEEHFGLQLSGCQRPQFLVYRQGDFFDAHQDNATGTDAAEFSRVRRVATVLFQNGESDEPREGSYGGGSLTFYGLMDDARLESYGLPLVGEPGLLIAFRPDTLHEITPVTHGERYTIVSWFI